MNTIVWGPFEADIWLCFIFTEDNIVLMEV